MVEILIETIDCLLAEDGRTVIGYGYGRDDSIYIQSVTCPMQIEEAAFLGMDWITAFRRDGWRQVA